MELNITFVIKWLRNLVIGNETLFVLKLFQGPRGTEEVQDPPEGLVIRVHQDYLA
jgi:hypothetical protein